MAFLVVMLLIGTTVSTDSVDAQGKPKADKPKEGTPDKESKKSGDHNTDQRDCPPGMRMPRNCDDVERMAHRLAVKKKGYMDGSEFGRNGIPDVMERPYLVNQNDCSTGNAHMACMFNDECTAEFGELLGMRSNSARHATTLFRGKDGTEFECDFTPESSGIMIRHNADTMVGEAFPDPGEHMDPAYNCAMNGANYSALNAGGMNDLATMLALLQLLQQMQNNDSNQDDEAQYYGSPTPTPTPALSTPTPAPTATPTATPGGFFASSASQDLSTTSYGGSPLQGRIPTEFAPLDTGNVFGDPVPRPKKQADNFPSGLEVNQLDSQARRGDSKAAWEAPRGDFFD